VVIPSVRHAVNTIPPSIESLPIRRDDDGSLHVEFDAPRGLYQWSVVADGSDYDWERMYFNLPDERGVDLVRTGPWDFCPLPNGGARPVVPAYWVDVDGKRMGLWFFQRVPVADIAPKRFRGRTALFLRTGGQHRVAFTPYRPMKICWVSAKLEPDPEDRLIPPPSGIREASKACPSALWADAAFWEDVRQKLRTTHSAFAAPLARVVESVCSNAENHVLEVPALAYAYRMAGKGEALRRLLELIELQVAAPHWGNPAIDGYSHNGDKHASMSLRAMAHAWQMLRDKIDEPLRSRLRAKLQLQGERYLDAALLNRDYWGGSLLQDHGWSPNWSYLSAALMLYGEVPEARDWIAWALPRMRRALAAMPRDGAIPQSQFGSVYLQAHDLSVCRDTFLAMSGEDLYDEAPLHLLSDYLCQTVRTETLGVVAALEARDDVPACGGASLLNAIASKRRDGRAAWLGRLMLDEIRQRPKWLMLQDPDPADQIWSFFTYDPSVEITPPAPRTHSLIHFADSGLVHFRDFEQDVTFSLRCGPPFGYHANRHARGPCDRLGMTPRWGTFSLYRGLAALIPLVPSGFTMRTALGSCLLIDDRGQREDVGYPMSLPSSPYYGQEIEAVEWDDARQTGMVRLNLAPAYPDELGVSRYHREFLLRPNERALICRDTVALDRPRQLSWLFHTCEDLSPRLNGMMFQIGHDTACATIQPQLRDKAIKAGIYPTCVVNGNRRDGRHFVHVRYDLVAATDSAAVDFIISWRD
jgi:hypothetical protein